MKVLLPYLKRYQKDAWLSFASVLVVVFASLWQPKILQTIMEAIMNQDKSVIMGEGIKIIGLALIGILAGILNTIFSARVALNISTDLRADMFKKIQTFAYADIEKFSASNLVVRMTNDINQVQMVVMAFFQQVTRIPIMLAGAFILAMITMPQQWWVVLIMLAIIIGVSLYSFTRMAKLFASTQKEIEEVNTLARENLMGIRVVKSFVQEPAQIEQFSETSDRLTDITTKIGYLFAMLMPVFFLAAHSAIGVSIFIVGKNIVAHPAYLAAISSFTTYMMIILFSVINGGMLMTFASRAFISLGRMREVLDTEPSMKFTADKDVEINGDITFDHVDFTYPGDDQATLQDLSFKVSAGQMIGIVGATGSGKTSLAQLIARLYDPQSGEVRLGDVNIKDVPEKELRETIAFVLQRGTLFSGTISSNLRQVKEDATMSNMQWAANIAQASEFIERLPENYDAPVEERSANFSGGQKQRLAITRGIIAEPKILILDDATSALDAKSEKLVQEALDRELKQTTTVVIAEKISAIIRADQIIVMDQGKLAGIGTHHDLVKNNEIYREIYLTQKAKEGGLANAGL